MDVKELMYRGWIIQIVCDHEIRPNLSVSLARAKVTKPGMKPVNTRDKAFEAARPIDAIEAALQHAKAYIDTLNF